MENTIKNSSLNSSLNTSLKHSNKNRSHAFIACLSVACLSLVLAGCGQSGALYIPNTPEAAQRSTLGDVLSKPASSTPTSTAPTVPTASSGPTTPATPALAK